MCENLYWNIHNSSNNSIASCIISFNSNVREINGKCFVADYSTIFSYCNKKLTPG